MKHTKKTKKKLILNDSNSLKMFSQTPTTSMIFEFLKGFDHGSDMLEYIETR